MSTDTTLPLDKLAYNRGCWFKGCNNEPIGANRNLHLVGYRDHEYTDETGVIVKMSKTVWAPCGTWQYYCSLHPMGDPLYFDMGQLCPHGSTPKERGVPTPSMPLVGATAIVLETDL